MGAIVRKRKRIDDTAAHKCQPRLPFEPGDVFGRSKAQRVHAVAEQGVEEAVHVGRRDRPVR
jgi:hypothetical protein